jgi:hypothetical protein
VLEATWDFCSFAMETRVTTCGTQASACLMSHIRSLGITGRERAFYSWRHRVASQPIIDAIPDPTVGMPK